MQQEQLKMMVNYDYYSPPSDPGWKQQWPLVRIQETVNLLITSFLPHQVTLHCSKQKCNASETHIHTSISKIVSFANIDRKDSPYFSSTVRDTHTQRQNDHRCACARG